METCFGPDAPFPVRRMTAVALQNGPAARAIFRPDAGAWLESLILDGAELLYRHDPPPENDLPGGCPVLYPICGRPPAGSPHPMHGYAWRLPWSVADASPSAATFRLDGPDGARLALRATLAPDRLDLALDVENRSDAPLRPHAGFHPYFRDIADVSVPAAKNRWAYRPGYVSLHPAPLPPPPSPIPADSPLHRDLLLEASEAVLRRRDGRLIHLRAAPDAFPFLQFYGTPAAPFLCVEPWSAPAGATAPDALFPAPVLPPGARRTFAFSIALR